MFNIDPFLKEMCNVDQSFFDRQIYQNKDGWKSIIRELYQNVDNFYTNKQITVKTLDPEATVKTLDPEANV